MRISDWSSDVCSSDLSTRSRSTRFRASRSVSPKSKPRSTRRWPPDASPRVSGGSWPGIARLCWHDVEKTNERNDPHQDHDQGLGNGSGGPLEIGRAHV